jgi:EmrB/QacA subfamily drug resistance transporter
LLEFSAASRDVERQQISPRMTTPKTQKSDKPKAKRAPASAHARWAGHTPLSHAEIRPIVFGIMLAMFLGALDQTIVATAMPTIGRGFGQFENLSWIVTAYLLTSTAVTPLYGKLSDMYGRRAMMLIAIGVFMAGSLACALAPNMLMLILGRGLQGLGAGGLLPLAQTVVGDIVMPKERGRYQTYMSFMWMTAAIAGPVLGGFLSEYFHWSLIFWINIPLGLLAFWMSNNVLKRLPSVARPHKLDILGSLLMMGAAVSLLLALTSGGVRFPWTSAPVLGLLTLSAVLWVLFIWRLRTAPEPFLPLAILSNQVVRTGTLLSACNISCLIGLTIFIPLYFELVMGLSSSLSGLALIPLMVVSNIGAAVSGRSLGWLHHYKRVPMVGLSISVLALISLTINPHQSLIMVLIHLGAVGVGIGTVYPVATVAVQNAVPRHQLGIATGTMNFFRALLSAIIVAGLGAIILGGINLKSGGLLAEALHASGGAAEVALVFRWVFAACGAVLAAALFWLILMEERPLPGRADIPVAASASPSPAAE